MTATQTEARSPHVICSLKSFKTKRSGSMKYELGTGLSNSSPADAKAKRRLT